MFFYINIIIYSIGICVLFDILFINDIFNGNLYNLYVLVYYCLCGFLFKRECFSNLFLKNVVICKWKKNVYIIDIIENFNIFFFV